MPGVINELLPKHHYDRHRTVCTAEDKLQASLIGGHQWNIINNKKDHGHLLHARNNDHFVDDQGRLTSHWFEKKKRVDLDGDGIIDCVDSTNVEEVMICPPTAGKEAARAQARQARQLCQASAPGDYAAYNGLRSSSIAPPTPRRDMGAGRTIPCQRQRRDQPERPSPRVVPKHLWTPRRGEPCRDPRPPPEHAIFRSPDQLRVESHIDVADQNFASALMSSQKGGLSATSAMAASGVNTARSMLQHEQPPKPAAEMTRHSLQRLDALDSREMSEWHLKAAPDRLRRQDPYHAKPIQQTGGSSVKYDIISGERRQFWY